MYVGSVYANASTQFTDSLTNRHVWNRFNRVLRPLLKSDSTFHTYATNTPRWWNNDSTQAVSWLAGQQEDAIHLTIGVHWSAGVDGSMAVFGIGLDTNSAINTHFGNNAALVNLGVRPEHEIGSDPADQIPLHGHRAAIRSARR